ncbi:MAG: 50S ribosomal protein L18 [Candidatus Aenigmatarchaeota archaeon]
MAKYKPTRKMQFRRRRECKTDYKRRLQLLRSGKPRLVVRKGVKYIRCQVLQFDPKGDRTVASAISQTLKKLGWTFACDNLPAAYLTGYMIGKFAKAGGVHEAVLDIGLYPSTKGSRLYAAAKGAIDAGLKVPCDEAMFPDEKRIRGEHIAARDAKAGEMPKTFEQVKEKVDKYGGKEKQGR